MQNIAIFITNCQIWGDFDIFENYLRKMGNGGGEESKKTFLAQVSQWQAAPLYLCDFLMIKISLIWTSPSQGVQGGTQITSAVHVQT